VPLETDTELAASRAFALDIGVQVESFPERATLDELVPGAIVPNESVPDKLASSKALLDRPASDGLASQTEQHKSESPTLGKSMSGGLT
jgi:hypothetical protein